MGNNPDKCEHWVDDALVSSCPVCYQPFTTTRRRHHCRIYCAEHLPYKMSLPISGEEKEVCKECYFEKPVYYREPSEEEESEETKRHKEMQRIQQENKEKKEEAEHKKKEREAEEKKAFREFAKAIEAGDLETMRDVIVAGIIDCNYSDDTVAMNSTNRLAVLKFLIDNGANVEKAYNSVKPIHSAILAGDYDAVKMLIERGKFKTTLFMATERNSRRIVQLLLEHGAVNDPEALALALKENYLDIAKLCLKWGAKKWPLEFNDLALKLQKDLENEK